MTMPLLALLRTLSAFHHELVVEYDAHRLGSRYDPVRWSCFSQRWNWRRRIWTRTYGLHMGEGGVTPKSDKARVAAAGIALFEYWKAIHFVMDYERTRPKGAGRLAFWLRTWRNEEVLHDRVLQTAQQYTDLFAEAQQVILGVRDDAS